MQLFFLHSILEPLLKAAQMGLIEVFFCDGVHLTYGYQGGYCWCKERKCIPSAYGRKRANLLGFMNARTYETTSVMNDSYLNADSVCKGMDKLRKRYPNKVLYVVLDNAAYQHCKKVQDKATELKINLVFLPPYSPNLNLIERLWKFLRKHLLANQYFPSFQEFFSAIEDFIQSVHIRNKLKLSSLLSLKFETLNSRCFVRS
jgi:transposase